MIHRHENAGSFADHGHLGPTADMMCQMYLDCSDRGVDCPTRIEMGRETWKYWLLALNRYGRQTTNYQESVYYTAEVRRNRGLDPGTMRFYKGDELVGEITGWTA
jgi:hypothetical protein